MPFEKGHNYGGKGGRPKSNKKKNKQRLIQYKPKHWQKSMHSYYDVDEINHRLENNLPLDDIFDSFKGKFERKNNNDKNV